MAAFSLEPGIHRIQRIPPTEKRGRRQTSTVAVAVLPCSEGLGREIPQSEVRFETARGSGPGGQHRNTRDTAVTAIHVPTGARATADGRSQYRNKADALAALSARIRSEQEEMLADRSNARRRRQIGDMGRGSRVRTYNLFRGFVKDERTGKKLDPKKVLAGHLDLIYGEQDLTAQSKNIK